MGDGDPVGQRQFFDTMSTSKKEILAAVEKVNDNVQKNNATLCVVDSKLTTHEKRMDKQDDKIESQKAWNRGLAAVEVLLASILVALGLRQQ